MSDNVWTDVMSNGKFLIVKDGIVKEFLTARKHPRKNVSQREFEAIEKAVELYGSDIIIHCDNAYACMRAKRKGLNVKQIKGEDNLADRKRFKKYRGRTIKSVGKAEDDKYSYVAHNGIRKMVQTSSFHGDAESDIKSLSASSPAPKPEPCRHEHWLMVLAPTNYLECKNKKCGCILRFNTDIENLLKLLRQQSELKGFNEAIDKAIKVLETMERSRYDDLNKISVKVSLSFQSGWLRGYSNCWKKAESALENLKRSG